ncbi:uncharacterized protein LOC117212524 [Bombus bifarius]|uniref:Uncharacterized protein LOC117212524 n=1 Tax=Bombus bifarius TaxID=103933 RepID=A0A6P8MXQ4_9HYME|nr:uncharacterized protein LOC117212524 [Bombus bifarius]
MDRGAKEDKAPKAKPKKMERLKRVRNKPEAIPVKVGQDKEWIQAYKEMMGAKNALRESNAIRKTKLDDILIEMKTRCDVSKTAADLNIALGGKLRAQPMLDKTSAEVKEVDPLMTKEELARELEVQLGIKDSSEMEVKPLRMALWGTQSAIVTLPNVYLNKGVSSRKIRTGLTIATIKALPNLVKCCKCHTFSHIANKCTAISSGKELCSKCGSKEHTIAACTNAPCCAICSKVEGIRFDHVTGSLACPEYERRSYR